MNTIQNGKTKLSEGDIIQLIHSNEKATVIHLDQFHPDSEQGAMDLLINGQVEQWEWVFYEDEIWIHEPADDPVEYDIINPSTLFTIKGDE